MPTDVCPARTTAAMLLMMKLQRLAPILANPLLYAYPFYSVVYNVGLVVVVGWLRCFGQGRLLGRLASVLWICAPAHVPDLQLWLVRVVVSFALVVRVLKVFVCVKQLLVCTIILSSCTIILCVCKQIFVCVFCPPTCCLIFKTCVAQNSYNI
jgi:hypothetical protein